MQTSGEEEKLLACAWPISQPPAHDSQPATRSSLTSFAMLHPNPAQPRRQSLPTKVSCVGVKQCDDPTGVCQDHDRPCAIHSLIWSAFDKYPFTKPRKYLTLLSADCIGPSSDHLTVQDLDQRPALTMLQEYGNVLLLLQAKWVTIFPCTSHQSRRESKKWVASEQVVDDDTTPSRCTSMCFHIPLEVP